MRISDWSSDVCSSDLHQRDGAALTRFLHWVALESPKGGLDELTASDKLHALRKETGELRDLSFDTISGAGPNGAVVHYRESEKTNRKLAPGQLYLVDSGGQSPDGPTDVTRQVPVRAPHAETRERITRALNGPLLHTPHALP